MINELLSMNGYAAYVMSAFSFTLLSFLGLYMITKLQFIKEQNKFVNKFGTSCSETCPVRLKMGLLFNF